MDPILKDWFPNDDAWIGHITNGTWEAFTGTTHVRDRVQIGAPDMSQAWQVFDTSESNLIGVPPLGNATTGDCTANACTPTEIAVGWGSTRTTFGRERQRYTTNPLCFDQINTRAKAREQFSAIVEAIRDMTQMIQSDYLRTASLRYIDNLYLCTAAAITGNTPSIPVTNTMITGQAAFVDIGGAGNLPQSSLTIQYLQRFWEPLQNEGYFRKKVVYGGMLKLITDPITSQQLTNGNPALTSGFKFSDFQKGGEMFKYGIRTAIGNYGIAWDGFPMRFYWDGTRLRRVWPYDNVAATIGVKRHVSQSYIKAPYQISQIWHEASLFRYVPKLESVNPMMPFMTRDLGGKWQFFGGERDRVLVVTTTDPVTGLPSKTIIDNKAGNQGLMWCEFDNGMEMQRPELSRLILHQRDPGCVTDAPACSVPPAYVTQSWAANPVCCTV